MKGIIIRFLLIETAALSVVGIINFINHSSYWEKTIFRTQTVDFNILAHTLPTKLSYALQKNDIAALQQTLNSNYELFGLVVTNCKTREKDCTNQNIQYLSTFGSKPKAWKKHLKPTDLENYPYSLLQNPPPLYAEWQYESPHSKDKERQVSRKLNKGEVIGRVYYVRGVPPSYLDDIKRWIQNPILDSGAGRIYSLSLIVCLLAGFSVWIVIEMILYRKNVNEKQLVLENEKLATLEENNRLKSEQQLVEEKNRHALEENKLLEVKHQLDKEKIKLLETENKLVKTRGFIGVIQEVIEQDFSSVISNHIQELESIFRRLNTDIENITHDMRKAPLIRSVANNSSRSIEKLSCLPLSENEKSAILQDVAQYMQDADQTIKFISWVIDDLNQIANLESEPVCVQEEIEKFSKNPPPNLCKEWLPIEFHNKCEENLWINNNSWHLRSIVKNVLYNSSAVLMNLYEEHDYDYQCKISVTCIRFGDEAGIVIEDNGPGFNEQALNKLYQAPGKVDINAEVIKGKGSIIVFAYLSIHRGRVELVNKPEGGAKATFLFPLISSIN